MKDLEISEDSQITDETEVVLILHKPPRIERDKISFDILVRKDLLGDKRTKALKRSFYDVSCDFAEEVERTYPQFKYVASEDLMHLWRVNAWVLEKLIRLLQPFNFAVVIETEE